MGRKLRREEIPHDLEWLLVRGLAVADNSRLPLTAAYIALAMDQYRRESATALSASKSAQATERPSRRPDTPSTTTMTELP
jgi:hypothetical protein